MWNLPSLAPVSGRGLRSESGLVHNLSSLSRANRSRSLYDLIHDSKSCQLSDCWYRSTDSAGHCLPVPSGADRRQTSLCFTSQRNTLLRENLLDEILTANGKPRKRHQRSEVSASISDLFAVLILCFMLEV